MKTATLALLSLCSLPLSACYFHLDTSDADWDVGVSETRKSSSIERFRDDNRANLQRLAVGMSLHEVQEVMGTKTIRAGDAIGTIHNPYRTESFRDGEGDAVLVFYYYTSVQKRDNIIKQDELTPVGFRDSKVVGWGKDFVYRELKRKDEIR